MSHTVHEYECSLNGTKYRKNIVAKSTGKARYLALQQWSETFDDVTFADITVRSLGVFSTRNEASEDFSNTARYRGVPFARIGMHVEVDGKRGQIVGTNSSANFDVYFPHIDNILNCHPTWMITYFDDAGNVIQSFGGRDVTN